MTDTSELEALKARVKELEAAPSPTGGLAAALGLVGSVGGLVPRWLVVVAGLVAVAWAGFEIYISAQSQLLDLGTKRAQNCDVRGHTLGDLTSALTLEKMTPAKQQWLADCAEYMPKQTREDENLARSPAQEVTSNNTIAETENQLPRIIRELKNGLPESSDAEIYQLAKGACEKKFGAGAACRP